MPKLPTLPAVLAFLAAMLTAQSVPADAPPTLSGKWSASGLSAKWVEGQWPEVCGGKPGSGGGGGSVVISQSGSELTISGGGRTYSTTQCFTTEPGMSVTGHSGGSRTWKTTCKTAPGSARIVTITTTLQASDDTISFYETGQYQYAAGTSACTASVGRYRTYTLQQRATAPQQPAASASAPAAAKGPAGPSDDRCAEPGAASRVDITPARRLMSAGDTFQFKATAVDAAGCRVWKKPKWTIEGAGTDVTVDGEGMVTVSQSAAETEVDVRVIFGQKSAAARVEIASKERFEALLARGETEAVGTAPAHSAVASKSLGAEAAVAEDRASGRKSMFLAIIAAVAAALGLAGVVMLRRSRRAASMEPVSSRRVSSQVPAPGPAAGPAPSTAPPPMAHPPAPAQPAPQPMKKLCPICGRQYPATSTFCGQDGANLIPMN